MCGMYLTLDTLRRLRGHGMINAPLQIPRMAVKHVICGHLRESTVRYTKRDLRLMQHR